MTDSMWSWLFWVAVNSHAAMRIGCFDLVEVLAGPC